MKLKKGQKIKIVENTKIGKQGNTRYGTVLKIYPAFVLCLIKGVRECFNYNDLRCKQVRIKVLEGAVNE